MTKRVAWAFFLLALGGSSLAAAQRGSTPVPQPSFDCTQANGAAERMVCAHTDLIALDVEMAAAFKNALDRSATTAAKKAAQTEQARWRAARNACASNVETAHQCIVDRYRARIAALNGAVKALGQTTPAPAKPNPLAGTSWQLVEIQSMDDATGVKKPSDPSLYTMQLQGDGSVTMRLNCNRATGRWSATTGSDSTSGRFEFGPLAATRALCPPPSLDEVLTAQSAYVRSYLLKDGRLSLSLMADGGIWVWRPAPTAR